MMSLSSRTLLVCTCTFMVCLPDVVCIRSELADSDVMAAAFVPPVRPHRIPPSVQAPLARPSNDDGPIVKADLLEQIKEALEALFKKIQETLQDEEFQQKVKDTAGVALEKAQDLAGQAMQYASDPEKQEEFRKAAQNLIASTAELAQDVADASQDDKKREQLLQRFQEQAKGAWQGAVATAQDPEFQKKVKDSVDTAKGAVQGAVDSVQSSRKS